MISKRGPLGFISAKNPQVLEKGSTRLSDGVLHGEEHKDKNSLQYPQVLPSQRAVITTQARARWTWNRPV